MFENDWALDYAAGLSRSGDADSPAAILRALDDAASLDSRECATALAAAEAVAASSGQPVAGLPDGVLMWLERTGARAGAEEVQLALRVVGMIADQNRGLRDQQDETGASLAGWLAPIEDLQRRLRAAEPSPAEAGPGAASSPSRRLQDLAAQRGPSGARSREDAPGVESTWRKVRGGVLFAVRDARGLAVTLDTTYGGRRTYLGSPTGLRRHAPLYVWGDEVGTWPKHFVTLTRCPVYQEYHWDDVAETGISVDLVHRWLAAEGDDEVIWAELDREHEVLARRFEEFVLGLRPVLVAELEKQGRPVDAATLAGWDLPRLEAWLADGEKKRITAKHDRLHQAAKRFREGVAEINARYASAPPDRTEGTELIE